MRGPEERDGGRKPEDLDPHLLEDEDGLENLPTVPLMELPEGKNEEETEEEEPGEGSLLRDYFETVLVAVLIVLFLQTFLFQQSKIPSSSMEETLLVGDHILVNKFVFQPTPWDLAWLPHRDPRWGDLVVFRPPSDPAREYIKRVVGLPGDVLALRDGRLFRNYAPVEEPWVKLALQKARGRDMRALTVPDGHYFVMGDNRDESQDSRVWGSIPRDAIHGRAVFVWFSLRPAPYPAEAGDPRTRLKRAVERVLSLPGQGRWDRTLKPIR